MPQPTCPSVHAHNALVKRTLRYSVGGHGGDYHAKPFQKANIKRLTAMRACWKHSYPAAYRVEKRVWNRERTTWRQYRYYDRVTPYGEWSIPTYIVACETGGTFSYRVYNRSGSGASGAYQIMPGTWAAYGGLRYAGAAASAPAYAQHIVAARIYRASGGSPWSCA